MHLATAQLNEKEHVECLEPGCLNSKEVTRDELLLVVPQEGVPAAALPRPHRSRWQMLAFQDVPDSRAPNVVAKFDKFSLELAVTPTGVLPSQEQQHVDQFRVGYSTREKVLPFESPLAPDQFPVPFEQGIRPEKEGRLVQADASLAPNGGESSSKDCQMELFPTGDARGSRMAALKDPQLLTQKQDLEVFVALGTVTDGEQVKEHRDELSD